jgi:aminomethyltransferase
LGRDDAEDETMTDDLLRTALSGAHEDAGAAMAPFAGWNMPLRFAGTIAEHDAVRTAAGAFDVSHLGTVWLDGPDARAVVAASFTNDPTTLPDLCSQYTLCCDDDGGIVDDLIVYRLGPDRWLTMPNAANTAAVVATLTAAAEGRDVQVRDESRDWAVLAVQGPNALALLDGLELDLAGLCDVPSDVAHLQLAELDLAGEQGVLARTGYTGEPGAELLVPNTAAPALWARLLDAGAEPCGLGARDTLRLEMGYPLHGNELSTDVNPYEARLGWAVKLDRDPFRGQDALRAAKAAGTTRRLLGLRTDGRRLARAGMRVVRDGADVGQVTSGGFSPTLERGIALAFLDTAVEPGDEVAVDVRGTPLPFEVVRPPFVDRDPRG